MNTRRHTRILPLAAWILAAPLTWLHANDGSSIDAGQIWTQHCKKCHAADGSGSTKIGQTFGVRDYTDPAVQATFSDEEIVEVVKNGVIKNGKKKMPPYADKLTDAEIDALVQIVRGFAK